MASKAKSAAGLTKRVKRFLEKERFRDRHLKKLLDELQEHSNVYLFGGVLRDIALYGIDRFESDIDLVYVGDDEQIAKVVSQFPHELNKFGGFRISADYWFVDLWSASETWAFRHGYRKYSGVESLLSTTITNWESILYELNDQRLIYGMGYFEALNEGFLDVVLPENPNKLGMCVKLIRAYVCKDALNLSTNAVAVLKSCLDEFSFDQVRSYEASHYRQRYIDRTVDSYLRKHERIGKPDLLPVELENAKETLPLF